LLDLPVPFWEAVCERYD